MKSRRINIIEQELERRIENMGEITPLADIGTESGMLVEEIDADEEST
jgi:hypothetical protein